MVNIPGENQGNVRIICGSAQSTSFLPQRNSCPSIASEALRSTSNTLYGSALQRSNVPLPFYLGQTQTITFTPGAQQ